MATPHGGGRVYLCFICFFCQTFDDASSRRPNIVSICDCETGSTADGEFFLPTLPEVAKKCFPCHFQASNIISHLLIPRYCYRLRLTISRFESISVAAFNASQGDTYKLPRRRFIIMPRQVPRCSPKDYKGVCMYIQHIFCEVGWRFNNKRTPSVHAPLVKSLLSVSGTRDEQPTNAADELHA